jgi:ribosomal protein S18 acetylase RimI-like enzyme
MLNSVMANLSIKPIQLELHRDTCVSFREDSFVVSFGDSKKFYEEDGKGAERYIDWLKAKISRDPFSAVHVWRGDNIIGQIEMGKLRSDPSCGYVNLYYLIASERGRGLGKLLDDHAIEYFKSQQLQRAQLSVSPQNILAISFYEKRGWRNLGPREDDPGVLLMEKLIK